MKQWDSGLPRRGMNFGSTVGVDVQLLRKQLIESVSSACDWQ